MANPPQDVQQFGQSIWMDNIRRKLLEDGTFQKYIDEYGVLGVTSNPTIFQKAIGNSDDYDDSMSHLLDLEPEEIYERLAIEDIQHATDLFRPVYERTNGKDGYVSLEVSPLLANQTEKTIAEARRLFEAVDRPNVMIKIPATPEGIPAIEETIAAGINVNVTLIFAVENYIQVAEAYIRGLERRLEAGEDVTRVASVASFFLSRIDTMIDKILQDNIHAAKVQGDQGRVAANNDLLGKAAIISAKLAYKHFQEMFYGERFARLQEAGASVQRPLWASTSTKNPAYPDTMYVDTLIGKDTVNTLPPDTLDAFKDHGTARGETILEDIDQAQDILDMLAEVGVDMVQVTKRLQDDGVDAFADSFKDLIDQVDSKRNILQTGVMNRQKLAMGIYVDAVQAAVKSHKDQHFNSRLWNHDGSLWKGDGPALAKIENRLGWLHVLDTIDLQRLKELQAEVKDGDFDHVVLLGMGGSSLAPEVLATTFDKQDGFPGFSVLDSTHPDQIKLVENSLNLDRTLFIVSSKSGGTIETLSLYKYFYERVGHKGAQFIAITDEGSQLEALARENHFRDVFLNPADIGGRYSALSYFGLVPAALIGLDLDRLWENTGGMIKACGPIVPEESHPGISLGAVMGALSVEGRDKVCIFTSPSIGNFGDWIEQLLAESLGKEQKGLVPVVGTSVGRPHDYATDRLFIYLKIEGDPENADMDASIRALGEAGHPRVTISLPDRYALAGEFFRWEYATAVAGQMMKINPFDEPNVAESKANTQRMLEHYREHGSLPASQVVIDGENVKLYANEHTLAPLRDLCEQHRYDSTNRTELLAAQITGTHAGDYFAMLAYLPSTQDIDRALEDVRRRLRHVTKRAVTLGYGPRYLHSTGQLHKGGPNNGIFLLLTTSFKEDIAIPGEPYSFGTLNTAQAIGDLQALQAHNRRVIHLHFSGDPLVGISKLLAAVDFVDERRY
jgi:transaldolase / glucose-6-phosphate isomerase